VVGIHYPLSSPSPVNLCQNEQCHITEDRNVQSYSVCKYSQIQQNSFNLTSNNSESLTIWHLRTAVPRQEILLFTREKKKKKKASSMEQADLVDMFKKGLQECLYTNHCGIS
jgi:hypothetical protein